MITNITFLIIGMIILVSAYLRGRFLISADRIKTYLQTNPEVPDEYMKDDVSYQGCYSQNWVVENLSTRKYGRFYRIINDVILDNTLYGFVFLGLILIFIPLVVWSVVLQAPAEIWPSMGITFVALFIIYGTGGPKVSEELVQSIDEQGTQVLSKKDFPFVSIAQSQLLGSVIIKVIIGAIFLILAPFASDLPSTFLSSTLFIVDPLFIAPFTVLAEVSYVLAFLFIAAEISLFLVIIGKAVSVLFGRVSPPVIFHVERYYPHRS